MSDNAVLASRIAELERQLSAERTEKQALAAQVEIARSIYVKLTNNVYFADNGGACYVADGKLMDEFNKWHDGTTATCLAQVRADAVEQALNAVGVPCTQFKNQSDKFTAGFNSCGAQLQLHANRIRQGGA